MFEKDLPGFLKYTAWRRTTPSGVAEYKSVTVCPDATAQEFMDMYLDDDFRRNWVSDGVGCSFTCQLEKPYPQVKGHTRSATGA
jgi:hypothetical protein